ncbi:MAG: ChaN family lipoprotein [Flavobacteriaceae bacterium]|nr:ChaN family lipoprotein [Flavobacteriaceae bacterium]
MNTFTRLFCLLIVNICIAQSEPQAFEIYNAHGKKVSYKKMMRNLTKADLVFFGETHNDPIAHWLQLEMAQEFVQKRALILGAEMLESDNQDELNQYLEGNISDKEFAETARLWSNYKTDYKPVVDFAKAQKIPFVATNIPRRYASLVYKNGLKVLDTLPQQEKQWMASLPIFFDPSLPTYEAIDKMGGHGGGSFMAASQASKDATMAHFIVKNIKPNHLFFHLNGSYHTKNREGIVWHVRIKRPDLQILTIATVAQKNIHTLEAAFENEADYIIVIPTNMTKTY